MSAGAAARALWRRLLWAPRATIAIAARPLLWPAALVQLWRLRPERWWARRPFLPLPDARWIAFRMETAYGDPRERPSAADVVAFVRWCAKR